MPQFTITHVIAEAVERTLSGGPLIGSMLSSAMLALGIAMMLVILFRRSGRYYQKLKRQAKKASRPGAQPDHRQQPMANVFDRASPLLDAPTTVVRWQVEMEDLARDIRAEIDTKMRMLQVLIRRSDEAAERLEAATTHAQRLGYLDRAREADAGSIESLAEQAAAMSRETASTPIPPHSGQIYSMADAGEKVAEIARQIGLPIGDVELALSLRVQR